MDNLLLAGRCISGDFVSHSSYRVTGTAAATGQAVGVAAALNAQKGCLPAELKWADVEQALQGTRQPDFCYSSGNNDASR
ncbi:MAG: FAD-dependent oxidoreductase [Kiritimatiellia bacterium]|jgi:hypothetical protein